MDERNLRELQAEIEKSRAGLAEVEGHSTARLRGLLAPLALNRRVRSALVVAVVAVATASHAAVPYTFTNGTIADEVNGNFDDLDARLAALEAGPTVTERSLSGSIPAGGTLSLTLNCSIPTLAGEALGGGFEIPANELVSVVRSLQGANATLWECTFLNKTAVARAATCYAMCFDSN